MALPFWQLFLICFFSLLFWVLIMSCLCVCCLEAIHQRRHLRPLQRHVTWKDEVDVKDPIALTIHYDDD
jgi:hypothetical protein